METMKTARAAAERAGECLMQMLGTAEISQKETTNNLVTQADVEAERLITETIRAKFPDHSFLLEEGQSTGTAEADHLWIVDPLDATNNYAHGIPHFCVSIAYAEKGVLQAGVILDPIRNECFHAERGKGAFMNDQPIHVTASNNLEECIVGTGFYYDRGALMEKTLKSIHTLFSRNIRGIRRMGSAALDLCWVANGRFDAFFEYQLAPWDYAAGKLIIEEAGGICTDRSGNPLVIDSRSVVVANPHVHALILDAVKWND
ncbi:MAG: myo-inositol-1(or 4)-monophosphatase [Limisphaerales bacterium]|jgi:myo-inositol-1(or 4)-monophosphatase